MGSPSNEIGYWGGATFLLDALRDHNRLPHRERTVRDLSVLFAAFASIEVQAAYGKAIANFLDRVPYGTVEERDDPERAEAIRMSFEPLRQQADPTNLVKEEIAGKIYFSMKPPYTESESHKSMLADQAALGRVLRLHLWASKAVESGTPGDDIGIDEAFEEMRVLDADDLFDMGARISDLERHNAQSAVSATAAVLALHANEGLWSTAEQTVTDVIRRAATMPDAENELSYRGAHVTGHPPAMAAHGYAALLRRDPSNPEWSAALFQLAIDPIEKVVEAVYDSAQVFADRAPDMIWRLFCLATQRAARTHRTERGLHWSEAEAEEQSALADEAEQTMVAGVQPSAHPAPATPGTRGVGSIYHSDFHANVLRLPIEPMLDQATREALIEHVGSALAWALASLGAKHAGGDTPYEWLHAFGSWFGRLIALLPATEVRTLLIARLDAAEPEAAAEIMEMVIRSFMIHRMLRKGPLDSGTLETWEMLVDWTIARPGWSATPVDARQHDRGMAVAVLFCGIVNGMVCGIDSDWPNLDAVLPAHERAVAAFSTEQTAFAAVLALLRARPERLLPQPGLNWVQRVARARKSQARFWSHASNGERLVLLLRDLIARGPLEPSDREIVIEVADTLIELGVKGAAFLQQDLVRLKR